MKKTILWVLTAALILSGMAFFTSCGERVNKYTIQTFEYFDTVTTVIGYESDKADFDKISAEILNELAAYHRLYDIYHEYDGVNNLCTVNSLSNGSHRTVTVDSRITDLLIFSKAFCEMTYGKVNVAMGSVLSLWHDCRIEAIATPDSAKIPSFEVLSNAAEHIDINKLVIDKENNTVFISDPEMTLDVGAVAKGYALERVAAKFEKNGINGYVINVGGNVRALGKRPDGEKWRIGIESPFNSSDEYISQIMLDGYSVATSGSYQRFYEIEGKRYHHIIDPSTLMPSEGFESVAVIAQSASLADVLSTALFCMEQKDGSALIESMDGVEAMWVLPDGSLIKTEGFSDFE